MPKWADESPDWVDDWLIRMEAFYNLGSRIVKFHSSPGTMAQRGVRLHDAEFRPLLREVAGRKMAIMTHIGDPDLWYAGKYGATPELQKKFGTRDEHYQDVGRSSRRIPRDPLDRRASRRQPRRPAAAAATPRSLPRPVARLLAQPAGWSARSVSRRRRGAANSSSATRTASCSAPTRSAGDDRGFDFLASRFWCHRKLWETAYIGPSPIADPDLPDDAQPTLRGLALPDAVLQKLYHDNAERFLSSVGAGASHTTR